MPKNIFIDDEENPDIKVKLTPIRSRDSKRIVKIDGEEYKIYFTSPEYGEYCSIRKIIQKKNCKPSSMSKTQYRKQNREQLIDYLDDLKVFITTSNFIWDKRVFNQIFVCIDELNIYKPEDGIIEFSMDWDKNEFIKPMLKKIKKLRTNVVRTYNMWNCDPEIIDILHDLIDSIKI